MVPITRGPKHHFFGYYDRSPWNLSQTRILAHESEFNDRPPAAGDKVVVGSIDLADRHFQALATGTAWNWQQGAMVAWHPADPDRRWVHNDCRHGRAVGLVRDLDGSEVATYDHPIYALSPNGQDAWSLSFARLAVFRPGYGYAGLSDPSINDDHPKADGVRLVDLQNGRDELIVSLDELARRDPLTSMAGQPHWVNHIQPNRSGSHIAFFHLWRHGTSGWGARLYVCERDGSALRCALDTGRVSHYDWLDDDRLLIWARRREGDERFILLDVRDDSYSTFGDLELREDGHASFSPDRSWVLNDTYPDRYDMRTIMLVKWPGGERTDIARAYSPKAKWWGEIRCDLHPRWSRDGRLVCVDSVHDGTRQIYVIDVTPETR
jgi:hypothetical protein